MDFYERCRNVARTCHASGISRQTVNHWQRRYDPHEPDPSGVAGLDFSHRM